MNLVQGSIYSASLVPVFLDGTTAVVGYFNPKVGFVSPDARAGGGRKVFDEAGAGAFLDDLHSVCLGSDEPSKDDEIVCDDVTRALVESGASPGVGDFVDPVR